MAASSKLVEEVLAKFREAGARSTFRLPSRVEKLSSLLVRQGLLTDWHVEKLLAGKYKGFFLGNYKLLGHIGTGGMSSVYLAEHTRMGDQRAIKVLPKSRVKDATYLARFQLEGQGNCVIKSSKYRASLNLDNDGTSITS